ncbi:MAG: transposase [Deltaproteobacteria bacterium]
MMRSTAWAPVGQRAYDVALRNRGKVLTVVGAIALDGVRATMTVEGGTSKEVFLEFVTQHLIPSLVPGDVVVMDNLGAHHALTVRDALKAVNVRTLFLPPYSPGERALRRRSEPCDRCTVRPVHGFSAERRASRCRHPELPCPRRRRPRIG